MAKDDNDNKEMKIQKSYFDVLGICCQSEVPLIEKILKHVDGVKDVNVIVTSRTVIVRHDTLLISQLEIVKILNQARLEANLRGDYGETDNNYKKKWPSVYSIVCGFFLLLSFFKYFYQPLQWFALVAVAVGIFPLMLKAWVSIRNFTIDINILVLITAAGTIALKDYWESGTVVFLFTIAEWLESRASHRADAVMSALTNLVPKRAILAETGEEMNTRDVKLNTILAVKDGQIIPLDGIIIDGKCEVDEKSLTGESFPVPKQKDSQVWAGTINLAGYITVKTTALADDCVVTRMGTLVEEAQKNKSKTQRFIDTCSKYYTPAVVLIAICIAVIPAAMKVHNLNKMLHLALVVLVSGCPCALILSTPVATSCALSKAATLGLRVKGADYLETLSHVKIMAFDKTGTITRGEFLVTDFRNIANDSDDSDVKQLLYWVSSIECKSSHPMASALVDYAKSNSIVPIPEKVEEFQNFPGEGIFGRIDGKDIYIGNQRISARAGSTSVPTLDGDSNEGKSLGYIFSGSSLIGRFCLSDVCRTGVKEAIKELRSMGIKTALLTGDSQSAANHAQDQLEGSIDEVHAGLLPEDKARIIKEYQTISTTAMIGDGINDAAALATADIGISMGISGSALATETAHIILLSNDIRKIPKAIRLARRTKRKVIENVIFSISTKAGIIALALAGHPFVWAAVLADVGTCLLVILNSMLLLGSPSFGLRKSKKHEHAHVHKHTKKGDNCCSGTTSEAKCTSTKCGNFSIIDEKGEEQNKSCCSGTSSEANGTTEKCQTTCENNKTKNHEDHHHDHHHHHHHDNHDHQHDHDHHHDHGQLDHDHHNHNQHNHSDHDHHHHHHHDNRDHQHDHDHHHDHGQFDHDHHNHSDHDHHGHGHHDHQAFGHHHDHHHQHEDQHDGNHDDDIITEEELGKIVKECCKEYNRNIGGCCKSFQKECCWKNSHFGVGFAAGGLHEIVIE